MDKIKSVALITNFNIPDKINAAITVAGRFSDAGYEVLFCNQAREKLAHRIKLKNGFTFLPLERMYERADAYVVLGGDGSILEASRRAAMNDVPILGINLGRLGYMAEIELDEMAILDEFFRGNYSIKERSMLSVDIINTNGDKRFSSFALNDAVITNGSVARLVDLELYEGGDFVVSYRADGLIFATPTGSTAYSMSAGGAIVDPGLSCFCVTPICPHSLSSRPLIFPDTAILDAKNVCDREKKLFLTVDGRTNYELFHGETVRITKSEKTTKFISLRERGFYNILRHKLNNN